MTTKVVRSSKYRHVFGNGSKRGACYEGMQVSLDSNDWHLLKANRLFMSIHWDAAGGGAFLVHPLESSGRLVGGPALYTGHTGPVLDTDWHPFNEYVVASAGEDGRILLWNVPEGGPSTSSSDFAGELIGHERRIVDLAWHPTVENVLASASHDMTVRLWDVKQGITKQTLTGHCDAILDQCWSYEGNLLATSCKDKTLRIFDPRNGQITTERKAAHAGVKGIRLAWLGAGDRLLTTGFGRSSEREVAMWDLRKMDTHLTQIFIDSASGPLLPFYDPDCKILYLAGRGDGNVRYYEVLDEAPFLFALSEYKSTDPQRGMAMLPKRTVNVSENEIARFIKVYGSQPVLEPLSFKVPRRDNSTFAADIYPDTMAPTSVLTSEEFFDGKKAVPKLISMANGFKAMPRKEMAMTSSQSMDALEEPEKEDQLREAWRVLTKEVEQLRSEVNQKNIRIRQLESMLVQK